MIDLDGVRVAVDTCVGNDKERANPGWTHQHLPFLDGPDGRRASPPDTIDVVVCTHLHVDHVGWNTRLVDGQWVPTFPNARYVLAAPEFEYWQATAMNDGDDCSATRSPRSPTPVSPTSSPIDHRLDGGIRLDPTTGHTPGHVSVVIESAGERAVITGDMIHTPVQVADSRSARRRSTTTRPRRRRPAQSFLERYADDTLVIGTHWGGPGAGRIVADDGGWAVEPVAAD